MYIHVYIYIYITYILYIYIDRERAREREIERETDRGGRRDAYMHVIHTYMNSEVFVICKMYVVHPPFLPLLALLAHEDPPTI